MATDYQIVLSVLASQGIVTGEARRLFHGRGGCYPGLEWLTIDDFGDGLWLVLYREPEGDWPAFIRELRERWAPRRSWARLQRRFARPIGVEDIWGSAPAQPLAREGEWCFALTLGERQNTGYFMDAAPGRQWLRARAEGQRVLNLFAYTCAFSVAAVAGGASSVVNVDMSRAALAAGRDNHRFNAQSMADVRFLPHDIFRSWKRIREWGPYDLIIIDPPSFQRGSFDARKDYARILRRLPELAAHGAEVLACLNAPYLGADFLEGLVGEYLPQANIKGLLPGRADFPETRPALKMMVVTI